MEETTCIGNSSLVSFPMPGKSIFNRVLYSTLMVSVLKDGGQFKIKDVLNVTSCLH